MSNLQSSAMRNQLHRLMKLFLLITFSCLLVTACYSSASQKPDVATTVQLAETECRAVRHRLGEPCIPLKPQRIVALDVPAILDSLIALGIKPVGTAVDHFGNGKDWSGERYFPALLPELVAGIESVGAEGTPSLEKILELQPDLILIANQAEQSYKLLSAIAPTVLIDVWKDNIPVKENFRYIAQLLGREAAAEDVLNQYQRRVEEFQGQLEDAHLLGLEISVIGHYAGSFWISTDNESHFEVIKDIGLAIPPIFRQQKNLSTISIEAIDRFDGDVLFLVEDAGGSANFLSQNPLILSLKAVKNGRAYIVDRKIWDFYGPIGMNLFLDDLSKYLLEGKQDPYFSES